MSRRWADLLICESLANHLLGEVGHASAADTLVWSNAQLFLESTRFDRHGLHGRRDVVSLAALSDAHDGVRDSWPEAAQRMCQQRWIDIDVVEQITLRWWFGRMIGNTDMHFGNLSFFLDHARPLTLCPSYDMLPMLYRPAMEVWLPVNSRHPRHCQRPCHIGGGQPAGPVFSGSAWRNIRASPRSLPA